MDWTQIIIAGIGLFSLSGAGVFIFYRANKGGAIADAVQKSASAMEQMLNNAAKEREYFGKIIDDKNAEIARYMDQVTENRKQLCEQSYKISELERKAAGSAREIGLIKQVLAEVEGIACLEFDCKIRRPALGTYKHKTE